MKSIGEDHLATSDVNHLFVSGPEMLALADRTHDFPAFAAQWNELPPDPYLAEDTPFRFRRHAQVIFDSGSSDLTVLPAGEYLQASSHNPLFGGVRRRFAPIQWTTVTARILTGLIRLSVTRILHLPYRTLVNLHQVRIVGGPDHAGTPVPEGRHRDGFDFISIHLIDRDVDGGGETTLVAEDGEVTGMTLAEPMDAVYLDDRRFTHDTTPIVGHGREVRRDVLLMSFEESGEPRH